MSYSVSVRALCQFTSKHGDLDRRFMPGPTAQEGMLGHTRAAMRRGRHYETEISLTATQDRLRIRGRADGFDAAEHRLDEFKSHRGAIERMPANHRSLHWAQLKAYGAMLCRRDNCDHVDLALVYFDVDSQSETILKERFSASALEDFFRGACAQFSEWADHEMRHRTARDAALSRMTFPYPAFHAGQRQLAEAAYKAAHQGRCVLAQAPTGIGKTLGTLYPLLKAMAAGKIDKIFYLAAKTTGRELALNALRRIQEKQPAPLRILDLVAREKACLHRDRACHGESCPLAKGFYDRLAGARESALGCPVMDQAALRQVASAHRICPYYLSQEMVRWADVVVGDYNYYFDGGGLLFGLTLENDWRVGVLVDEAHNLVERARLMNTAALIRTELKQAVESAPASIKRELARVVRDWEGACDAQSAPYAAYGEPPRSLVGSLQRAAARITDHAIDNPGPMETALERFYFSVLSFCRLSESFGDHSLFDISLDGDDRRNSALTIRNVIPAGFLKARFEAARCVVLFSATLNPAKFYRDMLGLPSDTHCLDVPSPFDSSQLSVSVIRSISTRLTDRDASLAPISSLVAKTFAEKPGNYVVYLSSYEYLHGLFAHFTRHFAHIPVRVQRRSMNEGERAEFMNQFSVDGRGIAFAILGGPFAEGIDLPGERLIGAFIATLGMPQANAINDAIAKRLQSAFGTGHEYTYLYPGLQKVTQAAGRVIRTTSDRGRLYLIDSRYAWASVHRHLPGWWQIA